MDEIAAHELTGAEVAAALGCTPQNVYKLRRAGKLRPTRWLDGQRCRGGRMPLYDVRQVRRLRRNGYGGAK